MAARNYGANIDEAWAASAGCADGYAGLGPAVPKFVMREADCSSFQDV